MAYGTRSSLGSGRQSCFRKAYNVAAEAGGGISDFSKIEKFEIRKIEQLAKPASKEAGTPQDEGIKTGDWSKGDLQWRMKGIQSLYGSG